MLTSLYYGFWDYWELRHKVTFDGPNKLILINDGVTDLDVQSEIYSDWKEWTLLENNLKYLAAFSTVGGEPTVGSERLDVTYFLINGWKLKPYSGQYTLNLVGNIFDVNGEDIKVPADVVEGEPNNITINLNTSVIVRQVDSGTTVSGSGGLEADERTALFNIEDKVISIESLLQSPISASLVESQLIQLTNIESLATSQSQQIDYLVATNASQSIQLTNIESLATSQSLQISSLVSTNSSLLSINASQSLQLTSLTETNTSQSLQLSELQDKLFEVWQLHGLDSGFPLTVNQTSRTFGSVSQTISTTGTGSAQETIITRI